ncbi:hypothetical protein [Streptomyces qinglanensis]|uniref:Uncharacterized protein n=1 Tax=Streptomyces qinglanensis TaxID=943816 RepID=A0A1H9U485_9ACTN|nr:hypothetical protein [Streptomyces qinglanensis]SES04189.1 hypothetical protein SAMN05421870_107310 [Streptomyces qinglanensis]
MPHGGTSKNEYGKTNTGEETNTPALRADDSLTGPLALDSSGNAAPQRDYQLEAFGAFWLVYPRKRNREDARKEWIAAIDRGATPEHIVQAAKAYAHERATEDPRYTPYPATWLRRGAYDDEPDQPPLAAPFASGQPTPSNVIALPNQHRPSTTDARVQQAIDVGSRLQAAADAARAQENR